MYKWVRQVDHFALPALAALTFAPFFGAAAAAEGVEQGSALEEVVVTAARREERLQDVPISVTALTAATLEKSGIDQTSQLAQVTPGLVLARNSAIFQPTIRGVGSRAATAGDESNVAIYVDGVYQPETFAGAFDLLEIRRVEVLRGPQGTLFGRNSTGGLINVITAEPSFTPAGSVTAKVGNFDTSSFRAHVTGGLTDRVAADLSALYYEDGGYVDDLLSDRRLGDRRSVAARGKVLFQATDSLRAVLSVNYADQDDTSPVTTIPIAGNTRGRSVPGTIVATRPWTAALSFPTLTQVDQFGASLQLQAQLDRFDLESTTSYQENELFSFTDSDASQADLAGVRSNQSSDNISQEVRIASRGSEKFQWQAGAFFFMNTSRYEPFQVLGVNRVVASSLRSRNRTESAAVFAEGTYALTDALRLTGGVRYTNEDRHFVATRTNTAGVVNGTVDSETSFDQVTPRISLQYEFADNANAYVSYSRGFKSGVFNTGGINPVPVEPEILDAYEVGIKADPLNWLRTNASVFYYQYDDIQLSQRDPNGVSILQNAAGATMKGGEIELTAAVTPEFEIRLGVSVIDGVFDSFPNAAVTVPVASGGNTQIFVDASGNDVIRAPNYTASLGVNYSREFSAGTLQLSSNVFRSDKFYWEYLNRLSQSAYTQVNAQVGWTLPGERWRVVLAGENLTDKAVQQNVVTSTLGDYTFFGRPRSYSLAVTASF